MKTKVFFFSISLMLLFACNSKKSAISKYEELYIKTTLAMGSGTEMKKTETISKITSDYFEVSLSSQSTGGYLAQKDIVEPIPGEPFKAEFFQVSDKDGNNLKFMTSTEFLNFMSAHGYDLVNQIPNPYGGDYTFKKK